MSIDGGRLPADIVTRVFPFIHRASSPAASRIGVDRTAHSVSHQATTPTRSPERNINTYFVTCSPGSESCAEADGTHAARSIDDFLRRGMGIPTGSPPDPVIVGARRRPGPSPHQASGADEGSQTGLTGEEGRSPIETFVKAPGGGTFLIVNCKWELLNHDIEVLPLVLLIAASARRPGGSPRAWRSSWESRGGAPRC